MRSTTAKSRRGHTYRYVLVLPRHVQNSVCVAKATVHAVLQRSGRRSASTRTHDGTRAWMESRKRERSIRELTLSSSHHKCSFHAPRAAFLASRLRADVRSRDTRSRAENDTRARHPRRIPRATGQGKRISPRPTRPPAPWAAPRASSCACAGGAHRWSAMAFYGAPWTMQHHAEVRYSHEPRRADFSSPPLVEPV